MKKKVYIQPSISVHHITPHSILCSSIEVGLGSTNEQTSADDDIEEY